MIDDNKLDLEAIGQRLKEVRGKLSLDDFASVLDIHKNTYRNYEKGLRPFGVELIFKLEDIRVNSMWVVKGEGTPFIDGDNFGAIGPNEKILTSSFYENLRSLSKPDEGDKKNTDYPLMSDSYKERDRIYKERDHRSHSPVRKGSSIEATSYDLGDTPGTFARIPLYDVKASAGNGATVNTEDVIDSLAFKNEWIHNELHVNPAHLYLIYVEGESMVPSLRPGDVILVDHSDNTAKRDGVYVLRMDGALLVKRLQRLPGAIIKVSSDNTLYVPFEINLSKIGDTVSIIGRVVWTGRRL